jgi:hypothetical protein
MKRERKKERASDRARSGVVDREEEEEGRNNFTAARFASKEEMGEIPANEQVREREKERATKQGRELSTKKRRKRRGEIILQQIDLLLRIVRRFSKQYCEKTSKNIPEKSGNLGSGLWTSRTFKHGGNCSCFPMSFRK